MLHLGRGWGVLRVKMLHFFRFLKASLMDGFALKVSPPWSHFLFFLDPSIIINGTINQGVRKWFFSFRNVVFHPDKCHVHPKALLFILCIDNPFYRSWYLLNLNISRGGHRHKHRQSCRDLFDLHIKYFINPDKWSGEKWQGLILPEILTCL